MIELIILNLYGSIVPKDDKKTPFQIRDGFGSFVYKNTFLRFPGFGLLAPFKKVIPAKIIISAYKPRKKVESDLKKVFSEGIFLNPSGKQEKIISRVYSLEDMAYLPISKQYAPPYEKWIKGDFKTSMNKALCISDDKQDIKAAERYKIKAIKIPAFETHMDGHDFSYDKIPMSSDPKLKKIFLVQKLAGKPQKITVAKRSVKGSGTGTDDDYENSFGFSYLN